MKFARNKVFWFSALVLLAAVAYIFLSRREPRYKNEPLSYWANRYSDFVYSTNYYSGNGFQQMRAYAEDFRAATRQSGESGLSYFVHELGWKPPFWRKWVTRFNIQWTPLLPDSQEFSKHFGKAQFGFRTLGTNAVSALPALSKLLNDPRFSMQTASILPFVGDAAFPVMTNALLNTNPIVIGHVLTHLYEFHGHGRELEPILFRFAKDPTLPFRRQALGLFCSCNVPPDVAIPFLIESLVDKDENIRLEALAMLSCYGADAVAALPEVQKLKDDPSTRVRNIVPGTIAAINRDLAAKKK